MPGGKKGTKKGTKGGSPGTDYTGKNKYDKDWPPPVNVKLPKVQLKRLTRKIVLGHTNFYFFIIMPQNKFATEPQTQVVDQPYFENAERVNGQLAMIGFVAALGSYLTTGQIIPGIF